MEIQERIDDIKKRFDELQKSREELVEQGRQLQGRLNEVDTELVRLQGADRELRELLPKKDEDKKVSSPD